MFICFLNRYHFCYQILTENIKSLISTVIWTLKLFETELEVPGLNPYVAATYVFQNKSIYLYYSNNFLQNTQFIATKIINSIITMLKKYFWKY